MGQEYCQRQYSTTSAVVQRVRRSGGHLLATTAMFCARRDLAQKKALSSQMSTY